MIVRWYEYSTGISYYIGDDSLSFIRRGTREDDVGSVALGSGDLGRGTDGRHDDVGRDAMSTGGQSESLSMVARAVCHDAFAQLFLAQTAQCVEGTSSLEGANLLVVLAFEEEADLWFGGCTAFKWCSFERVGRLRGGSEMRDGVTCDGGSAVDMLLDGFMRRLNRRARQRWAGRDVAHDQ